MTATITYVLGLALLLAIKKQYRYVKK